MQFFDAKARTCLIYTRMFEFISFFVLRSQHEMAKKIIKIKLIYKEPFMMQIFFFFCFILSDSAAGQYPYLHTIFTYCVVCFSFSHTDYYIPIMQNVTETTIKKEQSIYAHKKNLLTNFLRNLFFLVFYYKFYLYDGDFRAFYCCKKYSDFFFIKNFEIIFFFLLYFQGVQRPQQI